MISQNLESTRDEFRISTDRTRLQIEVIREFLERESYWAKTRTRQQTEIAIENSLCFGLYLEARQIGFARVISDFATFAYLGDVFVLEEFRGRGLGRWLVQTVTEHPDLGDLRRWVLATQDAHTLYEKSGFGALKFPERWMEKPAPDAW